MRGGFCQRKFAGPHREFRAPPPLKEIGRASRPDWTGRFNSGLYFSGTKGGIRPRGLRQLTGARRAARAELGVASTTASRPGHHSPRAAGSRLAQGSPLRSQLTEAAGGLEGRNMLLMRCGEISSTGPGAPAESARAGVCGGPRGMGIFMVGCHHDRGAIRVTASVAEFHWLEAFAVPASRAASGGRQAEIVEDRHRGGAAPGVCPNNWARLRSTAKNRWLWNGPCIGTAFLLAPGTRPAVRAGRDWLHGSHFPE